MSTRRINLLPPDLARRRRSRQRAAGLGAAGLALVAVLALLFVVQVLRLGGERDRLEVQERENADLRSQVAELEEFEQRERDLQRRSQLLQQLTQLEVRWSVLLGDISLVIPSDVWLTNFTGQVETGEPTEAGERRLGTITFSGVTFSHVDVAKWLTRVGAVEGFIRPYLSISRKAAIGETEVVNFDSTVELSERSFRRSQPGARRVV